MGDTHVRVDMSHNACNDNGTSFSIFVGQKQDVCVYDTGISLLEGINYLVATKPI